MMLTPQQVIGPCLDKIVDGASGRKYSKLKTDAKASMLAIFAYHMASMAFGNPNAYVRGCACCAGFVHSP